MTEYQERLRSLALSDAEFVRSVLGMGQDTVEISVQVNGKMRGRVSVAADASQDVAVTAALQEPNVIKYMEGKPLKFSKYIPGRMVTLVV